MKARVRSLERVHSLYGVLTRVQELALHQASVGVHEAETQIAGHKALVKRASDESLAALSDGDDQVWQMYESQRTFMERDARRLLALRQEREARAQAAAEVYQAQRMELEQMQSVVDGQRARMKVEQSRREQQDADDRFLTRQRWLERRAVQRMNPS